MEAKAEALLFKLDRILGVQCCSLEGIRVLSMTRYYEDRLDEYNHSENSARREIILNDFTLQDVAIMVIHGMSSPIYSQQEFAGTGTTCGQAADVLRSYFFDNINHPRTVQSMEDKTSAHLQTLDVLLSLEQGTLEDYDVMGMSIGYDDFLDTFASMQPEAKRTCFDNYTFYDVAEMISDGMGRETCHGTTCGCVPCPNVAYCRVWQPPFIAGCHGGRCPTCNEQFGHNLTVVNTPFTCPICLETKPTSIKHPAHCSHYTCSDCFTEQWNPTPPADVEPSTFGFITTCSCRSCVKDKICPVSFQQWQNNFPQQYTLYLNAANKSDHDHATVLNLRPPPRSCPICRAVPNQEI